MAKDPRAIEEKLDVQLRKVTDAFDSVTKILTDMKDGEYMPPKEDLRKEVLRIRRSIELVHESNKETQIEVSKLRTRVSMIREFVNSEPFRLGIAKMVSAQMILDNSKHVSTGVENERF